MVAPDQQDAEQSDLHPEFAILLEQLHERMLQGDNCTTIEKLEDVELRARLASLRGCLELLQTAWSSQNSCHIHSQLTLNETRNDDSRVDSTTRQLSELSSVTIPRVLLEASGEIGRFRILEELGRGGHGIVFLAFDPSLMRQVALKVSRPEHLISASRQERFQREAQLAARLKHPNLVSIFETGEAGALTYLVTEYCAGPSLSKWLRSLKEPLTPSQTIKLLLPIVDAVAFMHFNGIIHRDIKPGNILFDSHPNLNSIGDPDSPTLKLTDFGLSILSGLNDRQTRTGTILGTLAYMAPEQVEPKSGDVGPSQDIYSIGVVLYEALTGQVPFGGTTDADLIRRLLTDDPVSPRRLRQAIPRDLEVICLKCLEKDAGNRYSTAADLSADLRLCLAGKPIKARAASAFERLVKWARRRPAIAALLLVLLVGLSGFVALIARHNLILQQYSQSLQDALEQAEISQQKLRLENYAVKIKSAEVMQNSDYRGDLKRLMSEMSPRTDDDQDRGFEWHYLRHASSSEWTLRGHLRVVYTVAISPSGKTLVSVSKDGTLRMWDLTTEQSVVLADNLNPRNDSMNDAEIVFHPSGNQFIVVVKRQITGALLIFDVASKTQIAQCPSEVMRRIDVAVPIPQSEAVAVLGMDSKERMQCVRWDWRTGAISPISFTDAKRPLGIDDRYWGGRNHDGSMVLLGSWSQRGFFVIEPSRVDQVRWVDTNEYGSVCHAWSHDGSAVYVAYGDGRVIEWKLPHFEKGLAWREENDFPVRCLALNPKRNVVAVSYLPGSKSNDSAHRIRLRDLETGKYLKEIDMGLEVYNLVWSTDGETLMVSGDDYLIRAIRPFAAKALTVLKANGQKEAWALAFAPDSKSLAVGYDDEQGSDRETLKIWDLKTGSESHSLDGHRNMVTALAYSTDGRQVYSVAFDGVIKAWNLENDRLMWELATGKDKLRCLAISPDGQTLATAGSLGVIRLWGVNQSPRPIDFDRHSKVIHSLVYDPSGKILASCDDDREVRMWNADTGALIQSLSDVEPVFGLAFSPDGQLLATVNKDGVVSLHSVHGTRPRVDLLGHKKNLMAVTFSPDGKSLATGGADGVRLWQVATGRELLCFNDLPDRVNRLAFSPDQKHLAAALMDGTVWVWHATDE